MLGGVLSSAGHWRLTLRPGEGVTGSSAVFGMSRLLPCGESNRLPWEDMATSSATLLRE